MEYDVLYDIAQEPFRWWQFFPCLFFLIGVAFPALLYLMHEPAKRTRIVKRLLLGASLVLFFVWLVAVLICMAPAWSSYKSAVKIRASDDFQVLEGTFDRVVSATGEAGGPDSVTGFYVRSDGAEERRFRSPFPDDTNIWELHLRRGDPVRVSYRGDVVLRIEARKH